MDSHFIYWRNAGLLAIACLTAPSAVAADSRQDVFDSFRHDAALADVTFIDTTTGWAVGDRGVIWHTSDGGQTWDQQTSATGCALTSVDFIDARRGWAVGGEHRPYPQPAAGTVLRTTDGGQTWTLVPNLLVPLLTRVQFFDAQRGIAIGQAAPFSPSGVFVTGDGGETWLPLPSDDASGWLAGDFLDPEAGAVAGEAGRVAILARRQIIHSPLAAPALHAYRAMRLAAPTGGWLVGDGGLVMTTRDLGRSWQSPPAELPEAAAAHFDFHALAVHGSQVWVAGTPGTRVFHSADAGQTWHVQSTGHTAPIRALAFVDAQHGWAVGDLGTILATRDSGRTWHAQRCGGRRAAILAMFARPADVPLELLADCGAAEGYIAAVDILHAAADARESTQPAAARARAAMLLAGAAAADTAWRFPLPPAELAHEPPDLLAELNRANDGRAVEYLERHLVRTLRMWRPDVVLTHHSDVDRSDPRAALLSTLILRAIEAAADPERHPLLASDSGLAAWRVKKVYGRLPADARGSEAVFAGRFSPLLGATLEDFSSPARHLLEARSSKPGAYQLALLRTEVAAEVATHGVLAGIAVEPGSDARRPLRALPENDLEAVRRLATRRRHLAELLARSEGKASWAAEVTGLIADLPEQMGGELLLQLADGYRSAGQLDLAADTYYALSRRYPDHPLADRALTWLVQFYASSEAAIAASADARPAADVRQTSFDEQQPHTPAASLSRDDRLRRAVQLVEYFRSSRPAVYADPVVRFAEVAAQRQLGFSNPAKRYFLSLRQLPENDPWRQCAETEQWLAQPTDLPPPKPLASCRLAPVRPHLDGRLAEAFWEAADIIRLHNNSPRRGEARGEARGPAELRLAYDAEHLYVAIRCPHAASAAPGPPSDAPRPRDADLTQYDRVMLRLDTDRDFSTSLELTIDSRGWTHDACCGNAAWNPSWYVAAASDEESWTIEAAIPLAELAHEAPAARHVWALAARRIVPRTGYESWASPSAPADASPAQFGFLIFE